MSFTNILWLHTGVGVAIAFAWVRFDKYKEANNRFNDNVMLITTEMTRILEEAKAKAESEIEAREVGD